MNFFHLLKEKGREIFELIGFCRAVLVVVLVGEICGRQYITNGWKSKF